MRELVKGLYFLRQCCLYDFGKKKKICLSSFFFFFFNSGWLFGEEADVSELLRGVCAML